MLANESAPMVHTPLPASADKPVVDPTRCQTPALGELSLFTLLGLVSCRNPEPLLRHGPAHFCALCEA